MEPVTAIGLASSILTFIDIGYKVVTGTWETAKTGQAAHTKHIDVVAHDLEDAVARFSGTVSPGASESEKALQKISVKCQAISKKLVDLLMRFAVPRGEHGNTWDHFRITIRRMRKNSEVQELQTSLAEYRSQVIFHLLTILNDRQLATHIQVGEWVGENRTVLSEIKTVTAGISNKLEQTVRDLQSASTRPMPGIGEPLPGQDALLDKLEKQFQEVKGALDLLAARCSEKTPETRILENVYFGQSMFQREETLKSAEETTFRWFVDGVSSRGDSGGGSLPSTSCGLQKSKVASHFQNWLRSGSGVFHISGKAGSGKSTLMKLILSTQRTHGLLREWAGDKRLLFARFYFWSGGDHMQNSLEGLHRSILFEVLLQRPDLVRDVFSEAHKILAHNSWESPIDSRFFTKSEVQKAFERLVRLPADPKHRLCLFIDGLDEYGAAFISGSLPQTEREDLAQSLVGWARNSNVKILASSRPYPEFSDIFCEDQRVHLHQLTRDDMIEFGRRLFERHRTFGFPGVQGGYKSLVADVVEASDGVFLWTGLTIQRMLASLARRDPFKSLYTQLEATPRELNLLYEKMFSDIDENDRNEAMKMMLLVSEERKQVGPSYPSGRINALAISWLESLKDPEFPMNQPAMVYSEAEIEEQRQFAESRVNGYTQGLLEVINTKPQGNTKTSYWQNTVQFFHRTAMEYVAASPLARNVLSQSPSLFSVEFYTRLSLAELHFAPLHYDREGIDTSTFHRYSLILMRCLDTSEPCSSLIDSYKAVFQQHARLFDGSGFRLEFNLFDDFINCSRDQSSTRSFDHWIANSSQGPGAVQYLTEKIRAFPDLTRPDNGLSLLLSVACDLYPETFTISRLEWVQAVLALGADLNHTTCLMLEEHTKPRISEDFSVWQIWCLYYVTIQLVGWGTQAVGKYPLMSHILEIFLQTGLDSDCDILMRANGSTEESRSPVNSDSEEIECRDFTIGRHDCDTAYVISLGDFVRQIKPGNYDRLERLLGIHNCTREFSSTDLGEIEAELATSKHSHFKSPTVRPVDLKQFFTNERGEKLMVYWIRWRNSTIPGSISFRVY